MSCNNTYNNNFREDVYKYFFSSENILDMLKAYEIIHKSELINKPTYLEIKYSDIEPNQPNKPNKPNKPTYLKASRAITSFCTSEVPSPMVQSLESR